MTAEAAVRPHANDLLWTSLQTDSHTDTSSLSSFYWPNDLVLFLTSNQQCQSTEGIKLQQKVCFKLTAQIIIRYAGWCIKHFTWQNQPSEISIILPMLTISWKREAIYKQQFTCHVKLFRIMLADSTSWHHIPLTHSCCCCCHCSSMLTKRNTGNRAFIGRGLLCEQIYPMDAHINTHVIQLQYQRAGQRWTDWLTI